MKLIIWIVGLIAVAVAIDRLLLGMEARGWLYYRRTKGRRGGAIYHMLEMHSIFEPGIQQVLELSVHEEQDEEESGAPPGGEGVDGEGPSTPDADISAGRGGSE